MNKCTDKDPFLNRQALSLNNMMVAERGAGKWRRIIIKWNQICPHDSIARIQHCYAAVIHTKNMNIYGDDEKSLLAWKFGALTLLSPIFYIAKTIFHLFFPISIYKYYTLEKKNWEALKAKPHPLNLPPSLHQKQPKLIRLILKNCLDICRTPLYALTISITSLGTLILSLFNSNYLYEGREILGNLQLSLNWERQKPYYFETIAPCMLPIDNLQDVASRRSYTQRDTDYEGPPGTLVHGLNNLARCHVLYWKSFNKKEKTIEPYRSSFLEKKSL
ncbi:hypothetical protein DB41_IP00030 [Neochlamydia sp. TUME1]|uniref:hypothetical protein n=1 Tax=Neochlamydia sp. TUME1 TaxID=1478174 RepID=UPI0005831F30|nr:hypothetical protein [Neochlamydia sp. TUME1]KIC74403.1 hypothetical protein DB41_IP00030 [Neochlamydia sp. TUME1]